MGSDRFALAQTPSIATDSRAAKLTERHIRAEWTKRNGAPGLNELTERRIRGSTNGTVYIKGYLRLLGSGIQNHMISNLLNFNIYLVEYNNIIYHRCKLLLSSLKVKVWKLNWQKVQSYVTDMINCGHGLTIRHTLKVITEMVCVVVGRLFLQFPFVILKQSLFWTYHDKHDCTYIFLLLY